MFCVMVFRWLVPWIFLSRVTVYLDLLMFDDITNVEISHFHTSGSLYFTVPFTMPVSVALSQCLWVGGWGCPSSRKISLMILDSFAFRNSAPSSASADNAANVFIIWHKVNITPLRCMGCLSCGFHPRKKFPAALLLASLADKWDAPDWKFSIMSEK